MKQDIIVNRAAMITKNAELYQEFHFGHPISKVRVNQIYNSHFTGSPLWDLFSKEAIMIENSWNRSMRITMELPLRTHRYLLEPVVREVHLKLLLAKLFLGFIEQIEKSPKSFMIQLLNKVKYDVRSTTGKNLRMLMLLTERSSVDEICREDYKKIDYHKINDSEQWRVSIIEEIIDIK